MPPKSSIYCFNSTTTITITHEWRLLRDGWDQREIRWKIENAMECYGFIEKLQLQRKGSSVVIVVSTIMVIQKINPLNRSFFILQNIQVESCTIMITISQLTSQKDVANASRTSLYLHTCILAHKLLFQGCNDLLSIFQRKYVQVTQCHVTVDYAMT